MSFPPRLLVNAIVRLTEGAGGQATVLAKGGAEAGSLLLVCAARGEVTGILERLLQVDGYGWQRVGPGDDAERADYLARRRARDPDLWLIELDIAQAERFAAESLRFG